ncbi:MAG: hypothetical protein IPJ27_01265 [Candidatus Accumulibacter sp.]|uniref:Uncharacterized protein n=1 Tax=Candidatus Accumulibacter proximus TaxID=2954385 RepID=A0A935UFK4_9PROT|nr:hypothetical protein [Candidatus Accumulibacter proximus]
MGPALEGISYTGPFIPVSITRRPSFEKSGLCRMPPLLAAIQPKGFVIATGVQYSVRDSVNAAAKELGMLKAAGLKNPTEVVKLKRCAW